MSEDTIDMYGYCASFCVEPDEDTPNKGRTVEDHGRWCRSRAVSAEGITPIGERLGVHVEAISEYRHGTVPKGSIELNNKLNRTVGISLGDGFDPNVFLTPGEARQLAAALTHLADVASGIDAPARRCR